MPRLAEIVRLRTADCRAAAKSLLALAAADGVVEGAGDGAGAGAGDPVAAEHLAECLRCQAEVAAYRKILRHLRSLRRDEVPAPAGALAAVLAALEAAALEEPLSSAHRVLRVAYVGGLTVATAAAGAGGLLVWINPRKQG
jgi:threonine dehydrogenase-like Zn-dependent dehydrogenase